MKDERCIFSMVIDKESNLDALIRAAGKLGVKATWIDCMSSGDDNFVRVRQTSMTEFTVCRGSSDEQGSSNKA